MLPQLLKPSLVGWKKKSWESASTGLGSVRAVARSFLVAVFTNALLAPLLSRLG
jgi:hypothetical protein